MALDLEKFMVVTIGLEFRAKSREGGRPVDVPTEWAWCSPANDDGLQELLERLSEAASEERLFALLQELSAESAVGSGEWAEMTLDDIQRDGLIPAGVESVGGPATVRGDD